MKSVVTALVAVSSAADAAADEHAAVYADAHAAAVEVELVEVIANTNTIAARDVISMDVDLSNILYGILEPHFVIYDVLSKERTKGRTKIQVN